MIAYSNGCSITYGYLVDKNSWSNLIFYDFNHINDSKCGVGNDYIFHQTLESITKLIDENKKPDYAVIQWSAPNRRLHCDIDEKIYFVNLCDANRKYLPKYEPLASEQTLHYMFCLQEFLKNNNIEYRFFNYMELDKSIKKLNIFNKIDFSKFITFEINNILYNGMVYYMKKNNLVIDNDGHPSISGQHFIAKYVAESLGIKFEYIIKKSNYII